MDSAELERISTTLTVALADARRIMHAKGIDEEFRTVARHAREMHSILVAALVEAEAFLPNDELPKMERAADDVINTLEVLVARHDGRLQ